MIPDWRNGDKEIAPIYASASGESSARGEIANLANLAKSYSSRLMLSLSHAQPQTPRRDYKMLTSGAASGFVFPLINLA
jgi:hypothetical protein